MDFIVGKRILNLPRLLQKKSSNLHVDPALVNGRLLLCASNSAGCGTLPILLQGQSTPDDLGMDDPGYVTRGFLPQPVFWLIPLCFSITGRGGKRAGGPSYHALLFLIVKFDGGEGLMICSRIGSM